MSEVVESIKKELIKRCKEYNEKYNYDFWNDHIKYVVKNAVELAKEYNADVEIVELGALLHDIAMPSEFGPREEHNVYGMKIADELLTKLNYPEDRKEKVKECVLRHRGSKDLPRNTIEEQCVADADVIAHFDCIPSLFHLVYNEMNLSVEDGEEYLKKKLERDYNKLSDRTRKVIKNRYENIIKVLFVNNKTVRDNSFNAGNCYAGNIIDDTFIDFLIKAKKSTYANNTIEKVKESRIGSSDYNYEEIINNKKYIYHDTYFGGIKFMGEEVVYCDNNKPIWGMNYYGITYDDTLGEEAMDNALRPALMKVGEFKNVIPVRGPIKFENNGYIYTFKTTGTIENFDGIEQIYKENNLIYELHCSGGIIK